MQRFADRLPRLHRIAPGRELSTTPMQTRTCCSRRLPSRASQGCCLATFTNDSTTPTAISLTPNRPEKSA
jgi:hypothetical protein